MTFTALDYEDEIRAKRKAIRALFGPAAYVGCYIQELAASGAEASCYPLGIVNDYRKIQVSGQTSLDALTKLENRAKDAVAEYEIDTIRRMALAIISLTDRDGVVTENTLSRESKIDMDRVRQMSFAACEKATEMGQRDFTILQAEQEVA